MKDQSMTYLGLMENNEEIRIVLVGRTGAGKSATGNTILGCRAFTSKQSFKSVTTTCNKASGEVSGSKVSVIDTPGLFDTWFSEYETIKEVIKCITCAAPGPHVFLAVIKVGRFTAEERKVVAKIQEAFGRSSDKYTMILFTHGDLLDSSIEDSLNESPELQKLISKYSGVYHVFNNQSEDPSQVTKLLEKINKMVLKNGGSHYTNQMFQEEARRQELENMMNSSNLTAASSDEEKANFVMEHRAELIQCVPASTVMSTISSLEDKVSHEIMAEIQAAETSEGKMETLFTSLLYGGEKDVIAALYDALTQGVCVALRTQDDNDSKTAAENEPLLPQDVDPVEEMPPEEMDSDTGSDTGRELQDEYYPLTHNPRGKCLIINNERFKDGIQRRGTEEDEKALDSVFSRLGFKVEIHKDLTAQSIREVLENLGEDNFMNADALVVCVLSHGRRGCVVGTDGKNVSLNELKDPFRSRHAHTLAGKPKLFFIQADQGGHLQQGSDEDVQSMLFPDVADFLVSMATVEGFHAFRNRRGSHYIQELCVQLEKAAERGGEDILDILTRVNLEVSRQVYQLRRTEAVQIPEYKCTLTKKLKLTYI